MILVVGSTGSVGSEVVRALRERGERVRVLVRREVAMDGVEVVRGSLDDRASLDRALAGVDRAFFVTPHSPNEGALGVQFIEACEAAKLKRLVFSSAALPSAKNRVLRRIVHALTGAVFSHYRGKLFVERRMHASPLHAITLKPTNFYQNDEIVLEGLKHGVYAQVLGARGINRVDTADIGDAAARALLDDVPRGDYRVVGPRAWTQEQCAALWSQVTGRAIASGTWDDWKRYSTSLDAQKSSDFDRTLRLIQRFGTANVGRGHEETRVILGRAPRSYEAYVSSLAARG